MTRQDTLCIVSNMEQTALILTAPIAHTGDPITSKMAAAKINRGARQRQADQVLTALRRYTNCTAFELAQYMGLDPMDYQMTRRRLCDLERATPPQVRKVGRRDCRVTGNPSTTWSVL